MNTQPTAKSDVLPITPAYDGGPNPTLKEKIAIMGKEIDRLRGQEDVLVRALKAALPDTSRREVQTQIRLALKLVRGEQ